MIEKRQRWPSRTIFIFAAVGSAVGLGNIWRFPYLVGKYGGGAFLFPYILLLFLFGVPLLILEFSLGQKMQLGAVGSFRKIGDKYSGVGVAACLCSFFIACYYSVIMGWSLIYLYYSFFIGWGDSPATFFFQEVLHTGNTPEDLWIIPTHTLYAVLLCWIFVYFCIWRGVKSVSKVVTITMPLPVILLIILLIRGVTLPGSIEGLQFFLTPNFLALLDLEVWLAAMTQIFFSLTVGVGVMIAYGSYEKKNSDIVKTSFIIALADASIAILAGLVVFTTLGYMAHQGEGTIADLAATGPSLAFIVFPKALSLIPAAPFFAVLFFLTLLLLGIDSLFSLVEAVSTTLHDRWSFMRKEDITLYVCVLCFFGGVTFTTSAGIYFLDITDHYVTSYGIVTVSLLQCLIMGWVMGAENMRTWINSVSEWNLGKWWNVSICYLCPAVLCILLATGFMRDYSIPYEGYSSWALVFMGWLVVAFIFLAGLIFSYLTTYKGFLPFRYRRKK